MAFCLAARHTAHGCAILVTEQIRLDGGWREERRARKGFVFISEALFLGGRCEQDLEDGVGARKIPNKGDGYSKRQNSSLIN